MSLGIIWQTSTNNSQWVDMRSPSSYKIDWEDLDGNSYRSCINGNLIRDVIKRRWAKMSMSFSGISDTQCETLLSAVNKDTVYFKFKSPAFGSQNWISFKGYVSKMSVECLDAQKGWDVSFNVIQSEGESWQ